MVLREICFVEKYWVGIATLQARRGNLPDREECWRPEREGESGIQFSLE